MNRYQRDNRPHLKPVEKAELSESNIKIRIILFVIILVIGVVSFSIGFKYLLSASEGWQVIAVDSANKQNCGNEFILSYNLGATDLSATAEKKALTLLYTAQSEKCHKIFNCDEPYEGVCNVYYINNHPNEVIEVETVLYNAFELLEKYGNRYIYFGPVYAMYDDMFYYESESDIASCDPYQNEEVLADFKSVAQYANNPEMIQVQLLGNNQIFLHVSEQYQQFYKDDYLRNYIDFFWMKNAFIADEIATKLMENGYYNGSLSSFDGFTVSLDSSSTQYAYKIYDKRNGKIVTAAEIPYSGKTSIVTLRQFVMSSVDQKFYKELDNGETRTSYLDVNTCLDHCAFSNLTCRSEKETCAEMLMNMISCYIYENSDFTDLDYDWITVKDGKISTNITDVQYNSDYQK